MIKGEKEKERKKEEGETTRDDNAGFSIPSALGTSTRQLDGNVHPRRARNYVNGGNAYTLARASAFPVGISISFSRFGRSNLSRRPKFSDQRPERLTKSSRISLSLCRIPEVSFIIRTITPRDAEIGFSIGQVEGISTEFLFSPFQARDRLRASI